MLKCYNYVNPFLIISFQDNGSETFGLVKNMWSIDPSDQASCIDNYCVMDGQKSGKERIIIQGRPVDIYFGIDELLKECDYICNVLPKNRETDTILGNGKLQLCQGMFFKVK